MPGRDENGLTHALRNLLEAGRGGKSSIALHWKVIAERLRSFWWIARVPPNPDRQVAYSVTFPGQHAQRDDRREENQVNCDDRLTEAEFAAFRPNGEVVRYLELTRKRLGLERRAMLDWGSGRGEYVAWLRDAGSSAFGAEIRREAGMAAQYLTDVPYPARARPIEESIEATAATIVGARLPPSKNSRRRCLPVTGWRNTARRRSTAPRSNRTSIRWRVGRASIRCQCNACSLVSSAP